MAEQEVTIRELSLTIAAMESRMQIQFDSINRRLDSLSFVHQETYRVQVGAMLDRIEALEEARQWVARTFVAAFAFPVIVGVMVAMAMAR